MQDLSFQKRGERWIPIFMGMTEGGGVGMTHNVSRVQEVADRRDAI